MSLRYIVLKQFNNIKFMKIIWLQHNNSVSLQENHEIETNF